MATPYRGATLPKETYFVSANCIDKKRILQSNRMVALLLDVLLYYRSQDKYLLHEFVVMPNHLHLLITTIDGTTLEKAMQLIKGGFSFRAKKQLQFSWEIWQSSFHDHRIRDPEEYARYRSYIHSNAVKVGLCQKPEDWPYCSASGKYPLDEGPQRLKPLQKSASTSQT